MEADEKYTDDKHKRIFRNNILEIILHATVKQTPLILSSPFLE